MCSNWPFLCPWPCTEYSKGTHISRLPERVGIIFHQDLGGLIVLIRPYRDDRFLDTERIRALERIVEHFTGVSDFSKANLCRLAESLHRKHKNERQQGDLSVGGAMESVSSDVTSDEDDIPPDTARTYLVK